MCALSWQPAQRRTLLGFLMVKVCVTGRPPRPDGGMDVDDAALRCSVMLFGTASNMAKRVSG